MALPTLQDADQYKYFVWHRHADRTAWSNYRVELLASNGASLRRLVAMPRHAVFQVFHNETAARRVITAIEDAATHANAMLGYSMFDEEPTMALIHTANDLDPGWIGFPFGPASHFPTLPISAVAAPSLRIVGGATIDLRSGEPLLTAAIEQRGNRFLQSADAFNIMAHVTDWKLFARTGQGEAARELRIARQPPKTKNQSAVRLQKLWHLDPVIYREFQNDPDFTLHFEVSFDRALMCLPDEWRSLWFQVPFNVRR